MICAHSENSNGRHATLLVVSEQRAIQHVSRHPHSANSLTAMIFLKDNVLLERDLQLQDVKPRLLGKYLVTFYN